MYEESVDERPEHMLQTASAAVVLQMLPVGPDICWRVYI